jgi:DNA polymerase-4
VRTADDEVLRQAVGSWAEGLRELAFGRDQRPVQPNHERKSIGCEETFARDLLDVDRIRRELEALARNAAAVLARKRLLARTVVLKLRYSNFETITRSETRQPPTCSEDEIVARTVALLEKTEAGRRPVRLLGASLHGLVVEAPAAEPTSPPPPQLDLL